MGERALGWVMAHPARARRRVRGEGGEGFYIAQSGRCPDLLVIGGCCQNEGCGFVLGLIDGDTGSSSEVPHPRLSRRSKYLSRLLRIAW
jgi:hypothetical protein